MRFLDYIMYINECVLLYIYNFIKNEEKSIQTECTYIE